jgi:hypothetical protein
MSDKISASLGIKEIQMKIKLLLLIKVFQRAGAIPLSQFVPD